MSKDNFQKELQEKIKEGIKPSDLKKKRQIISPISTPASTPPISPIIAPINKSWNGWNNEKELESEKDKQIQELQREVQFWSQTAQTHLTNLQQATAENDYLKEQVKELKNNPVQLSQEIEQALKEANEKIRSLEAKNKSLIQIIAKLENQTKNTTNNKAEELFTCFSCSKSFSKKLIRLVDKENNKTCRDCLLKMLNQANQETGEEIVLRKKKKEENLEQPTFSCQICQQKYQGEPHQVHITNYQEQGIIPQELTSICSPCLEDKVIIANFYCPQTSEGRDTWNPQEPQFDCSCPTNL